MYWSCDRDTIHTRLTRDYDLRHPFVGVGMGFVAYPALAAAVRNAGGLGVLEATPDPAPSLPVMIAEIRRLTNCPWGVDLICAKAVGGRRAVSRRAPAGRPGPDPCSRRSVAGRSRAPA